MDTHVAIDHSIDNQTGDSATIAVAGYWGPPKRFEAPSKITCLRFIRTWSTCQVKYAMSKTPSKTSILDDGLRYKNKVGGSPFVTTSHPGKATMSCFLCGKHRPRSEMITRKLVGKSQAVCAPKCGV